MDMIWEQQKKVLSIDEEYIFIFEETDAELV